MSPFIETIKIQDGIVHNLQFHQSRFEKTRLENLNLKTHPDLVRLIQVPDGLHAGIYKCRITYGKEIALIEYERQTFTPVRSLRLVVSDEVSYGYKYADRSELARLFKQKDSCDDIIIVKDGCITDSYTANLALWDGSVWYTPDTPLLPGTMRASLMEKGVLKEKRITRVDLSGYLELRLINAMRDLDTGESIRIERIVIP